MSQKYRSIPVGFARYLLEEGQRIRRVPLGAIHAECAERMPSFTEEQHTMMSAYEYVIGQTRDFCSSIGVSYAETMSGDNATRLRFAAFLGVLAPDERDDILGTYAPHGR